MDRRTVASAAGTANIPTPDAMSNALGQDSSANPPLVSIVLACYNSEKYLAQTVDSVLAQTYPHWELIAVDDCSTDQTAEMLKVYAQQDARVRPVFRTVRGGRPAVTKNTGLQHLLGRFVAFIDHDDLYLPTKLEASVAGLLDYPEAVALFHELNFVDGDGLIGERYLGNLLRDAADFFTETRPGEFLSSPRFFVFQMLRYAGFHTITTLIARDRLPPDFDLTFDTRYQVCDDTDLWIRLGLAGRVVYLDRSLARYRIHGGNITSNNVKLVKDITKLLEFNFAARVDRLTGDERRLLRLRLANAQADLGWAQRGAGHRYAALAAYARAMWLAPGLARVWDLSKSALPVRRPLA